MSNYTGTIIEESLEDAAVLKKIHIFSTEVEDVVEEHKTPWISKWTLHKVDIPESIAPDIAIEISHSLDSKHNWYADYKNDTHHYIIFKNKVFFIDKKDAAKYKEAKQYGISLGIPDYQVDFHPEF